jgi:hypothetical protein
MKGSFSALKPRRPLPELRHNPLDRLGRYRQMLSNLAGGQVQPEVQVNNRQPLGVEGLSWVTSQDKIKKAVAGSPVWTLAVRSPDLVHLKPISRQSRLLELIERRSLFVIELPVAGWRLAATKPTRPRIAIPARSLACVHLGQLRRRERVHGRRCAGNGGNNSP